MRQRSSPCVEREPSGELRAKVEEAARICSAGLLEAGVTIVE